MKQFEIFLNGYKVGDYTQTVYDFPSTIGNFQRQPLPNAELETLLNAYIKFCLEAETIGSNCDYGEAWDDYFFAHENEHLYLIDKAKWQAKPPNKEPFDITVPIFYSENEIMFR
ncbi:MULTISPECIES: hypothetical protein [unclassified Moraxella]|uniref:hypothetical protein n=1 Tax=unclassified Moraxella TaxID=2685852 RepID=UPI003AF6737C